VQPVHQDLAFNLAYHVGLTSEIQPLAIVSIAEKAVKKRHIIIPTPRTMIRKVTKQCIEGLFKAP
jgi:hypothetical protein